MLHRGRGKVLASGHVSGSVAVFAIRTCQYAFAIGACKFALQDRMGDHKDSDQSTRRRIVWTEVFVAGSYGGPN
jgi:hypothetical protein